VQQSLTLGIQCLNFVRDLPLKLIVDCILYYAIRRDVIELEGDVHRARRTIEACHNHATELKHQLRMCQVEQGIEQRRLAEYVFSFA
jgi:hypothetical protein